MTHPGRQVKISKTWQKIEKVPVSLILMFYGLVLYFQILGTAPFVFSDEFNYSFQSRKNNFSDNSLPNYLFFSVYRHTNFFGNSFLEAARIFNILFFIFGLFLIYILSKKKIGKNYAIVVTFLTFLGGNSTYTAYFMPESMYFALFWVLIFALMEESIPVNIKAISVGSLLGFMILVKPHAAFLIPGILLFLLMRRKTSHVLLVVFLVSASLLVVRIGLGFYFAGVNSLSFSGSLYNQIAETSLQEKIFSTNFIKAFLVNLSGHLFIVSTIYGLGLLTIANKNRLRIVNLKNDEFLYLAVAILLPLILISTMFSALTVNLGPYESYFRISSRYYAFALPLLLIQVFNQKDKNIQKPTIMATCVFFALMIAPFIDSNFFKFQPVLTDNPELTFFVSSHFSAYCILTALIVMLILFFKYPKKMNSAYLNLYLPLVFVLIFLNSMQVLQANKLQNPYDAAGVTTKQLFKISEFNQIQVVGESVSGAFNYLFQVDSLEPRWIEKAQGSSIQEVDIEKGKNILILVGDYRVDFTYNFKLNQSGYSIFWLDR